MSEAAPPARLASYYGGVVDDTAALLAAGDIEGVDEELALLRASLRKFVRIDDDTSGEDYELMLKSVRLIVHTVAERYRISDKQRDQVDRNAAAELRAVRESVFGPESEGA
jgi:hypothetical protein